MGTLLAKKLSPDATLPTVAHPGEDLGFDLYASETVTLYPGQVVKVRTGIALRYVDLSGVDHQKHYGLILKDRSSLAAKGITTSAGVIDAGYQGEVCVLMTLGGNGTLREVAEEAVENLRKAGTADNIDALIYLPVNEFVLEGLASYTIHQGDKIAQVIPIEVGTGAVVDVEDLGRSTRGAAGFGSSGV
jgi:dUTP pyrophosphatase